jgi:peptide/nickel transport system substrate-binding protein
MSGSSEHIWISKLKQHLAEGRIDRREFLRTTTLLGLSAAAAYAFAGRIAGDSAISRARAALPQGGHLRIGMRVHDIKDAHVVSWTEASNLARQVFDYLTRTDQDNVTRPYLLEKWDASEDLKTWTLHLRKDVKWHNGRKFVADDVVWNLQQVLDAKIGSSVLGLMKSYMLDEYEIDEVDKDGKKKKATRLWDANAIQKLDDYTVRLNTKVPQLAVPEHLFHYPFPITDPEAGGKFGVGINGTGPFELVQYQTTRGAVLHARKDYWGGAPHVDTLEFIDTGDEPATAIAALASKQVDGLYEVDFSQLDAVKGLDHVMLYPATTAQTGVARFKYNMKPFNDARVRTAMKVAIDHGATLQTVFRGAGIPGEDHHVCPIHPEYAKLPTVGHDLDKARKLLAEAGYPNGLDLEIACKGQPAWELNTTQVLAEQWKAAGIRVKINLMPAAAYWDVWTKAPFSFTSWAHRPLGIMTLGLAYRSGVPWNESSYSNPEFDHLLSEAEGIIDVDKRREVMAKLERILLDDGPFVLPIWRGVQTAYDKRVQGFRMHPTQYIFGQDLAITA